MIRTLLDKRLAKYQQAGRKGTAMVNREKAYLSAMVTWGMEHIEGLGLPANPFNNVKKFKEVARDRYVTDEELKKQSEVAREVAAYLPIVFEITYLCAARGIEAVDLTRKNIQPDGLLINRRKGSDDNIIVFSPRLKAATDAALAMHKQGTVRTMKLFVNTRGEALTKGALDTAMQRVKELMEQRNLGETYWSLHLLALQTRRTSVLAGMRPRQCRGDMTTPWIGSSRRGEGLFLNSENLFLNRVPILPVFLLSY